MKTIMTALLGLSVLAGVRPRLAPPTGRFRVGVIACQVNTRTLSAPGDRDYR